MEKIKAGIIGAAGYTAGELIRILNHHPSVEIELLQSESQAGKSITTVHKDLFGDTELVFSKEINTSNLDVVFLCKGHGESSKLIEANPELLKVKVIDLSQDFRLTGDHDFVYGLSEFNEPQIKAANHIANPGCFATAIQLAVLPGLKAGLVAGDVHTSGITGSTGAGQAFSSTSHFSWRSNNASVYKPLVHQHLHEIDQSCGRLNNEWDGKINFIPYRGAFTRGIITTSYFSTEASAEELISAYQKEYEDMSFIHVINENPDLKMVVNTNKAVIFPTVVEGKGMVISVIDNLIKGAAGQAVQNMNLVFDLPESAGLNLKASTF